MTGVGGAFLLGVVSAASLGFGALTARLWKPTDFVLGLLTAFGAGALLSAVTIDIVAPALDVGEVGWLAGGAIVGGLAFEALNRTINARGGFLRKASTSITFLRDREQRRRRAVLEGLERIDIFDGLPDRELDAVARAFRTGRLESGETLYRHGDPCDHLNVLCSGRIRLATPDEDVMLEPFQAFGHLAFVSGTPHRSTATAECDSEVLRLSRDRLRSVLESCPVLGTRIAERVRSEDLLDYLETHHPEIDDSALRSWWEHIESEGIGRLPQLVDLAPTTPAEHLVDHLSDAGPFRSASRDTLHDLASLMFREEHEAGYVFFRPGESSDRMYVVEDGDITVVGGADGSDGIMRLDTGDEFGASSCLTGMPHTSTAIAQGDSEVWVLRRTDLQRLMATNHEIRARIGAFLAGRQAREYLEVEHDLDVGRASTLRKQAVSSAQRGVLPHPVVGKLAQGAPLAIWLGLLLDGMPESLVIGATADAVRISFIVGIFLSNYPEALASSVGMREQDYGWRNIAGLWGTVILVTGCGAAAGAVVFERAAEHAFAVVEGLAAGAMLTVITQTMMPEALHRSGGFVGLAALGGFLITTIIGA